MKVASNGAMPRTAIGALLSSGGASEFRQSFVTGRTPPPFPPSFLSAFFFNTSEIGICSLPQQQLPLPTLLDRRPPGSPKPAVVRKICHAGFVCNSHVKSSS